jgi:hypothetical protein
MIPELTEAEIGRFQSKIERGGDCWLWTSETNNRGYGRFIIYRAGRRVRILAHRLSYVLANGCDLDEETVLRHDCDNPPCCNPAHLRPGTQADNMQDAVERGRTNTEGLTAYRRERDHRALRRLESNEKQCSRCRTIKPFGDFFRNKTEIDGRGRWCKDCMAERQRQYRREKRESGLSERQRRKLKRERATAPVEVAS